MSYIGSYSTVQCSKEFNMGKDTLSKYLLNVNPFKGKIFSRVYYITHKLTMPL